MEEATQNRAIVESVQKMAGTFNKDIVSIIACVVTSIEKAESEFTIDCAPISGDAETDIPGVKLNAEANDGFLIIPELGSTVMVVNSTRNEYYVYMYSAISAILCIIDGGNKFRFDVNGFVWNDGALGGLAKIIALTQKINNIENALNSHITAYNIHTHAGVTVGTGVTGITTPDTTVLTPTERSEIEDTKIKH